MSEHEVMSLCIHVLLEEPQTKLLPFLLLSQAEQMFILCSKPAIVLARVKGKKNRTGTTKHTSVLLTQSVPYRMI